MLFLRWQRIEGEMSDSDLVQAGGNMENSIAHIPAQSVQSWKADLLYLTLKLLLLANMYWLWLAVKLGSLGMFVVGLIPVSWVVTGPVAVWALIFDVPQWVLKAFT
jgi:hypothetical protein